MIAYDIIMIISFTIAIVLGSLTFYHIKQAQAISTQALIMQWKLFIAVCAQVSVSLVFSFAKPHRRTMCIGIEFTANCTLSDLRADTVRVHSLLLYYQLPVLRNSSLLRWRCLDENDSLLPCVGCSHYHRPYQRLQVSLREISRYFHGELHPLLFSLQKNSCKDWEDYGSAWPNQAKANKYEYSAKERVVCALSGNSSDGLRMERLRYFHRNGVEGLVCGFECTFDNSKWLEKCNRLAVEKDNLCTLQSRSDQFVHAEEEDDTGG